MSINNLSKVAAAKISEELSLPSEKQEIIEYGMIGLMSQLLSIAMLLIAAYIFGMVKDVVVLAACSAFLRKYSGGAHCSSPMRCAVLSSVTAPILVFLSRLVYGYGAVLYRPLTILIFLVSIVIIYMKAPKDSPSKPIKNINKIRKLKIKSVLLSAVISLTGFSLLYVNLGQTSVIMAFGVFNQVITLTKFGYSYIKLFDNMLKLLRV